MDQVERDIQAWEEAPSFRLIEGRRMQCKDIPELLFLMVVQEEARKHGWATAVRTHAELEASLGPLPPRLFLAKARKLIAAGKIDGCGCGCRGEFEISQGRATA